MGVDMATQDELIAARKSVEEIAEQINVDSLGYLSLEGLRSAVPQEGGAHCQACFNGDYPVPVGVKLTKKAFETGNLATTACETVP
jgi:amidophosphoribosyltransferase